MSDPHASGPVIGCWGTFDVANYGDLLFPRLFERELRDRLPHATVEAFAPLGSIRPIAMDGGFVATPLGPWSPHRRAWLAERLDLVAIGGGEILHLRDDVYRVYYDVDDRNAARFRPSKYFVEGLGPEHETSTAVALHAVGAPFDFDEEQGRRVREALATKSYVSVRDELSRERLQACGTDREIEVVPDSALLLPRLFDEELLARRVHYLRTIGAYPATGAPLVVHGSGWIESQAEGVAHALADTLRKRRLPVVLLEIGPCHGDSRFLDRIQPLLGVPTYRTRQSLTVEDVAAAIAHSFAYAGLSLHGVLTAHAFGVPAILLNLASYSKLDEYARMSGQRHLLVTSSDQLPVAFRRVLSTEGPSLPDERRRALVRQVDAHFDRLADLAERAWTARAPATATALARALADQRIRYDLLRRAYEERGRRLLYERLRLAERLEAAMPARADVAAELVELRAARSQLEVLDAECAALREELESIRAERDELRRSREEGPWHRGHEPI